MLRTRDILDEKNKILHQKARKLLSHLVVKIEKRSMK